MTLDRLSALRRAAQAGNRAPVQVSSPLAIEARTHQTPLHALTTVLNGGGVWPRRRWLAAALGWPLLAQAQESDAAAPEAAASPAADAAQTPQPAKATPKVARKKARAPARSAYPLAPGKSFWMPELSPEGPVVALVNLHTQHVQVYRNGVSIGYSSASTGKAGHGTPVGLFNVLEKRRHHRSSTYNNAPMPWMVRLTWGGIAFHQGNLPGFPASHGCIRLPGDFAPRLFGALERGSAVAVVRQVSQDGHLPLTTLAPIAPDGAPLLKPEMLSLPVYWAAASTAKTGSMAGESGSAVSAEDAAARAALQTAQPSPALAASATAPSGGLAQSPMPEPLALLASLSQQRLFVLQGGRVLASAALPVASQAAALQGQMLFLWTVAGQWQTAGTEALDLDDVLWRDVLPATEGFAQRLRPLLSPGSTLLVSHLPAVNEVHSAVYHLKPRT